MNSDHVAIDLIIVLSAGKEALVNDDPFDDFPCLFLNNENEVVKDVENNLLWLGLLNQSQRILVQKLSLLKVNGMFRCAILLLQLVQTHVANDDVHFIVDLRQNLFELDSHLS